MSYVYNPLIELFELFVSYMGYVRALCTSLSYLLELRLGLKLMGILLR
jgi:hypothetical protein